MKKITALFLVMMFIISTLGIQNVVAADNFNWNNLRAEYVYNSSRDELEIKIFLPSITRSPDERYDLEVEIDNRDYDKRMSYSSSQDEVYAIFDFDNINSSELDDYLDLDIKIEDEDRDEVFDGRIEMSSNGSMDNNSDDLDWDELDVDYSYSESSERLSITLELNDVNSSPRFRYTAMLESDNRDYEKTMTYSSSGDELKTTFTLNNVDEDDLEDYLDIELEIEDNQNVTVYQEDIDLEDSSSNNSSNNNSDDLDWGDLDVSYTYSESSERLSMTVLLEDVNRSPRFRYTAMLESDNRDYEKTMTYSSSRDELKTTFTINNVDEDDLEDYLDIELEIEDNQNTTVYKKDIDLEDSSSNNSSNNNDRYSWEDLKYSVVYEKDKNRLNVGLQLDNINNA
jgi:hypothetical protein